MSQRAADDDDDDDDDGGGDGGDKLPSVIILDGLHRITTTPLGDIFSALLDVELCNRSERYRGTGR